MEKKKTRNKNIRRTDPIYLRCTKGKGIKIIPIYVVHKTVPNELYYKIELHKRNSQSNEWEIINGDEKWNLQEDEISNLFDFITATTELRTKETISLLNTENDQLKAINLLIKNGKLLKLIENGLLDEEILNSLKYTIKLSELEKAIKELENLLDTSDTEKDYEDWCKNNIWVFGNYYVASDNIHQISNAEKVDLLVKNAINCYRDIIEFKKPSLHVLEKDITHDNYYFSKLLYQAKNLIKNLKIEKILKG